MPTGPKHYRIHEVLEGGKLVESGEECRCMMGEDHGEDGESLSESLSVWDAADICFPTAWTRTTRSATARMN
jgi:hypothetical protein